MLIDNKSLQQFLKDKQLYFAPVDGIWGMTTGIAVKNALRNIKGADRWPVARQRIAVEQMLMHNVGIDAGAIDGLIGPQTKFALEQWQNHVRTVPAVNTAITLLETKWPTQAQVPDFYGERGENQVPYIPPYQFYLYDSKTKVGYISVHRKVEPSLDRILRKVYEQYGPEAIHKLRLDRFFGSLNVRKMRGSNAWSMHSWGIALDFDANNNALRMTAKEATLARPIYDKWWEAWESEGWVSLGRQRNYDWMHVQAARL
jgi:hypothetical protein